MPSLKINNAWIALRVRKPYDFLIATRRRPTTSSPWPETGCRPRPWLPIAADRDLKAVQRRRQWPTQVAHAGNSEASGSDPEPGLVERRNANHPPAPHATGSCRAANSVARPSSQILNKSAICPSILQKPYGLYLATNATRIWSGIIPKSLACDLGGYFLRVLHEPREHGRPNHRVPCASRTTCMTEMTNSRMGRKVGLQGRTVQGGFDRSDGVLQFLWGCPRLRRIRGRKDGDCSR